MEEEWRCAVRCAMRARRWCAIRLARDSLTLPLPLVPLPPPPLARSPGLLAGSAAEGASLVGEESISSVAHRPSQSSGASFGVVAVLASLPASRPEVLGALLQSTDVDNAALPLSKSIKAASGRYRPDHGAHYTTPRKRLIELTSATYDHALADAPGNTLVVVAFSACAIVAGKHAKA